MPNLKIDGQMIQVPPGTSLLDATKQLGIEIPTLCHLPELELFTSCMICSVQDATSGKMLPACSAKAADGMVIETDSPEVHEARKIALELLLSEHIGDCDGPCKRICPAHMDIPRMIRQIAARQFDEAIVTIKEEIALPAILGRICPAPCEAGCRRKQVDVPLSICLLKRIVADIDLGADAPYQPECAADSEKRVAVIGAGPAGLSAAYYLRRAGHACTIFETADTPGGTLITEIDRERLPRQVINAEVATITALGVELKTGVRVGKDVAYADLLTEFDAVLLAIGPSSAPLAEQIGIPIASRGIEVEPATGATNIPKLFAAGGCVTPTKRAVRAGHEGKVAAAAIDQFLRGIPVVGIPTRYNHTMGKLTELEKKRFQATTVTPDATDVRQEPESLKRGLSPRQAAIEAGRCLRCDCRKPTACKLREYATRYGARQKRYAPEQRRPFEQLTTHPHLVYDPGKCIQCGICTRIAHAENEPLGLAFTNRGIDTRVAVPFNESLAKGLTTATARCIRNCPTGALATPEGE